MGFLFNILSNGKNDVYIQPKNIIQYWYYEEGYEEQYNPEEPCENVILPEEPCKNVILPEEPITTPIEKHT